MACYYPLQAYRARTTNESGARPIVFSRRAGYEDLPIKLACGQCVGCRLERSRQWAVRCLHEAKLHERNCFITLTYNDANVPVGNSLCLPDFQKFMKRLRKRFGEGIRFFHCGEYGPRTGRPHYHACLFGLDFDDKVLRRVNANGDNIYTSATLANLWPFGFHEIGEVTFQSAAYVARYIMKKMTGPAAQSHYEYVDDNGVVYERAPEYVTMSRRPGIGKDFVHKYVSDFYPDDFCIVNGKKCRPPRFYDSQYELIAPEEFHKVKVSRVLAGKEHADNNTPERLKVRRVIVEKKLERLKREGIE